MRSLKEIPVKAEIGRDRASSWRAAEVDALNSELETNGFAVLPSIVSPEQLRGHS